MLKMIDRGFAIVLVFGTVGHTFGSITKYGGHPEELLWALCASLFIALLAALNILRSVRPDDHALAWITVVGTVCWFCAAIAFGAIIDNALDPRVVVFAVACAGLVTFGLRSALGTPRAEE